MSEYRFISDPGHGWLAVPYHELLMLNIVNKISEHSHRDGNDIYLEEDVDALCFVDAWEQANKKKIKLIEVTLLQEADIRKMNSFKLI